MTLGWLTRGRCASGTEWQRRTISVTCRSTFEPQVVRDCENIDRRYDAATGAIRRDLDARVAGADRAIIAQAEFGRP
jgi:hypothetical protein